MKYKTIRKVFSFLTIVTFLLTNSSYAVPEAYLLSKNKHSLRVPLSFTKDRSFTDEMKAALIEAGLSDEFMVSSERSVDILALYVLARAKKLYIERRDRNLPFDLRVLVDEDIFSDTFYEELEEAGLDIEIRENNTAIYVRCGDRYLAVSKDTDVAVDSNKAIFSSIAVTGRLKFARGKTPKGTRLASNQNIGSFENASDLDRLRESIAADESVVVYIALTMLRATEKKREEYKAIFDTWYQNLREEEKDEYAVRLVRSAIDNPEAWKAFFASVSGDAERGVEIVRRTRGVFSLHETTEFRTEDLKKVTPENKVVLIGMDQTERRELSKSRDRRHHFTPELMVPTYGTLVGGAGSRYINSLEAEPDTVEALERQLGERGRFVKFFKSALPVGETDTTVLEMQIGSNEYIGSRLVVMSSHENREQALEFIGATIKELESRDRAKAPKMLSFVQPIVPWRVPRKENFRAFSETDKESTRGVDIASMLEYCEKHAGEIALNDQGEPIFGPENHWDFVKYLMQTGLFLDLFKDAMVDGELRDVILRTSNQDDLGAALGEDRPSKIATNILIDSLQGRGGLYEFLDEIEAMDDTEWKAYRETPGFRERLRNIKAAVVEGGQMVGYSTGGGIFDYQVKGNTQIVEKANIKGKLPETDITNSNAATRSLLAIALSIGLRPKDILLMIEAKEQTGVLSNGQKIALQNGVEEIEDRYVPMRQQVKVKDNRPIQGVNRDIHGADGRAYGLIELVGHSIDIYEVIMTQTDRELLEGRIDFARHQEVELDLAQDLIFVPIKHLDQWRSAKRPGLALAKVLGFRDESPVRSPEVVLSTLKGSKIPINFLYALQEEGYYLAVEDLSLVEGFLRNRSKKDILASDQKVYHKKQVDSMSQIIAVPASWVAADKDGFEKWIEAQSENVAVVILAFSRSEYGKVIEYHDKGIAYVKFVSNRENVSILYELFDVYGNKRNFGGFKLGDPYSLDQYKKVLDFVAEGV